jgi:endonuclease/exonuclease/phosphatase family metal-dependent hydrolase
LGVGRDDGQQKGEYSAILYRSDLYECLQQKTVWLSPTPDKPSKGWDAALERICTYGLFKHKKTKKLIWVMNTHFDHVGKEARLESAKQLWQLAESLQAQKKLPLVLMGDLNVRPEDPPLVFLNSVMHHARNLCAQPYGNPDTWNAFRFKEKPNGQIDHIFLHRAFPVTVQKYATITDSYDLKYPSDHLPVLAHLQFK